MTSYQRWKGIMKCYPFEEKRLVKWQPPYIVQPKFDGFRCRAVPTESGYLLLSSEENVFFSVPHLNEKFNEKFRLIDQEFDGELYNHQIYKEGGFDLLSSIISRTVNLHPRHKEIDFYCFDVMSDESQLKRQLFISNPQISNSFLKVAPFWLCQNLDDVMRAYDQIIEEGYEGIIVRNIAAPYQRKRSTMVMKFKPKKKDEYEIIGYEEEVSIKGIQKGQLGSLICLSGDGNVFSVGTGFSEEVRRSLWQSKEELKGKIAKVSYQHLTSGKKVPRFPVFVEIIEPSP